MSNPWSLVLFTLVVQAVAGHVVCLRLILFFGGCRPGAPWLKVQLIAGLVLMLAGLSCAMAHLGRPRASINAVRNIRHSWLSREVALVNLFAGALAGITGFSLMTPEGLPPWTLTGAGLIGGAALYAMARVYCLRTVPGWNRIQTPLGFLASALILGAVVSALSQLIFTLIAGHRPGPEQLTVCRTVAWVMLSAGLVIRLLAVSRGRLKASAGLGPLPVMQTTGVCLWSFFPVVPATHYPVTLLAAAVLIVAGEIADRIQFYTHYRRLGL